MGVHWKIRFLGGGGEQENKYTGGELLKKGEAWTVCRFKWGLAKKRGVWRGVDTMRVNLFNLHTCFNSLKIV